MEKNREDNSMQLHALLFSPTVLDCSTLPNITNGAVDLSEGTTFPSMAVYSCDAGYEMQGDPVRMCNASGVWNGTEPTCTGKQGHGIRILNV